MRGTDRHTRRRAETIVTVGMANHDPAMRVRAEELSEVGPALGGDAELIDEGSLRPRNVEERVFAPLKEPEVQAEAFAWMIDRLNTFVGVLSPRVRSAAAEYRPPGD
ncbi:hypothetical protein CR51_21925 [Caballeronia megalochromosomata]|nr:hypothetical protein CR51_21925 [Caballeronia megalochromosomata]